MVRASARRRPRAAGGLFLRRVRPDRVPLDLRRRPRRAGRRPPRSRPATSACRSSASACSTSRATSGRTSTTPAGSRRAYEDNDFHNLPLTARSGRRRRAGDASRSPIPGAHGARAGLARAGRPRAALPARHQHRRRTAPGGSRHHRPALRRRPGDAHPAGDPAGHRRLPRAGGAGHRARRSTT